MQQVTTPELFPADQTLVVELVRDATSNDDFYEDPNAHTIHCLIGYMNNDDSFQIILRLLDRRLDMNDANYTSMQTAKAMYIVRNLLLCGPQKLVNHYHAKKYIIRKLKDANIRKLGDSADLLRKIKSDSIEASELLDNPAELETRRLFFSSYRPPISSTQSGIEELVRRYTGEHLISDPAGMLIQISTIIASNIDDCDTVICMVERRLNLSDLNYSCSHALKALTVLQHCLGCEQFVNYWIKKFEILMHLKQASCKHPTCDNGNISEIHKASEDIMARLDHHQRYLVNITNWKQAKFEQETNHLICRTSTPPPSFNVPSSEDMRKAFPSIKDLSNCIRRQSRDPSGQGSYSDVFKERLSVTRDRIAVKQLRLMNGAEGKTLKKLNSELEIWSRLDHPYLNPLLGITFTHGHFPGFVSPWYKNGTLLVYLKAHPEVDRLSLFHKIVQAVQALHHDRPKVIHGDIKPANIMIQDNGDPALSDYGLSSIAESLGPSTSTSGTFRYKAPELLEGHRRTEASDVWALAGVCYAMYTGHEPYNDYSPVQLYNQIREGPPARPKKGDGIAMNNSLWDVLRDCWKPEPHMRPCTAALLEHLRKVPNSGISSRR